MKYIMLIITLLLVVGCTARQEEAFREKYEDEIKEEFKKIVDESIDENTQCEKPYKQHGTGCCLDQDDNGICDNDEEDDNIVCNPPYIRHRDDCCLDRNDNSICDEDESQAVDRPTPPVIDPKVEYSEVRNIRKTLGDSNAPVEITEWSDFECPFCARFADQTFPSIFEEYIKTGKVQFTFAHFPLSFHPNAQKAAEAAECAADQDAFWEMHDLLFENVKGGEASFITYADELNLDVDEFEECLTSGTYAELVAGEMQEGQDNGIRGTPGFLINGKVVSGAQPFARFAQEIEAALSGDEYEEAQPSEFDDNDLEDYIKNHALGDRDAELTIIEWSDFECPFCARFYSQAYQQIKEEYVESGKVKFLYLHFPLNFHPNAQKAAEATECARNQDAFWGMHDKFFEEGVKGGVTDFIAYADELGLDGEEFEDCLRSGETASLVKAQMAYGQSKGVSGTPGFLVGDKLISGAQPFESFQREIDAQLESPVDLPDPVVDIEDYIDDDAVKGDADAPITIIEWSDYECPFCARFFTQTLPLIEENYIETGKVKFIYRDFPLSFHPNAQKAAEAAECAGEQDAYFEMHDLLFEEGVEDGIPSFKQYALDLGLDADDFNACLDSGEMRSETTKDMSDGQAAGIRGTPGFLINGQLLSGAQPYESFERIIEAELAR